MLVKRWIWGERTLGWGEGLVAARVYVEVCPGHSTVHCVALLSPTHGVTESSLLNSNRISLGILGNGADWWGVSWDKATCRDPYSALNPGRHVDAPHTHSLC